MDFLFSQIANLAQFNELNQSIYAGKTAGVSGLSGVHKAVITAAICKTQNIKAFMIAPSDETAAKLHADLMNLGVNSLIFNSREFSPTASLSRSHEHEHSRIPPLSKILERAFEVVVMSAEAAISRTVPPALFKENYFTLQSGDEIDINTLRTKLIQLGYSFADTVNGKGQFSVRGGIVDIFPSNLNEPVRLDFWGDEIDTITSFDTDSQRRVNAADSVTVYPARENIPFDKVAFVSSLEKLANSKKTSDTLKSNIYKDIDALRAGLDIPFDRYLDQIYGEYATVLDYFNGYVFVCDSSSVSDKLKDLWKLENENLKAYLEEGIFPPSSKYFYLKTSKFLSILSGRSCAYLENFPKSKYLSDVSCSFNFTLKQLPGFTSTAQLIDDIEENTNKSIVILAGEEAAAKKLCEEINSYGLKADFKLNINKLNNKGVTVTSGSLSHGIEIPENGFTLLTYAKAAPKKRRQYYKKGSDIGSLDDLKLGDYVVHVSHGVGVFSGVQTMTVHGVTKDYIKIAYQGKDMLYVPVTSLDLVSKYIGAKDAGVKVNKLGSQEWIKAKQRVKKSVKDIAKQLTALYAKRMQQKGFAFAPDGDLQADFEAKFPYEETEDQLRCTTEIKADMESTAPMDRLLCGDVGFGKTEVALRAAFKCICSGKQCAILVPTTILAWQHIKVATERFAGIPVNIEMLSRFRTAKQQSVIKKDLKSGKIDLIIGTHRIIGKDIEFHDLGLLIIDEEQRFGVAQKEKLKELYPNVDVLTLSATPIPRTLNMALSGLRDMSSIEEAPSDRTPVQTYVLEQDEGVIISAIERELRRGGQVFYMYNRVESIISRAAQLQKRLPNAGIAVAHGKMSEEELSSVWRRMSDGEIDVLVCTTIIETGVDVPNANTLIIEDADRMGLSQLHQIRGRVGRSHRRAQAYFMYKAGKSLSEISKKRLEAIRDFTEFGSGFKIALRDLEIRGAGNVLGGEQHGHMDAVGYDMYIKLLGEAINEEKGVTPPKAQTECQIELLCSAHIPESYITALPQRLSVYRRIAGIQTEEDLLDVTDELIDRFGEPPSAVTLLMRVALLRSSASRAGINKITEAPFGISVYFESINPDKIISIMKLMQNRVTVKRDDTDYLTVKPQTGKTPLDTAFEVVRILEN